MECVVYSYADACSNIFNIIKTSGHSSLEKYTSHFIWKGSKGLRRVLLCERWVGDWTELQHNDPHSSGHNSVFFPVLLGCSTGGLGAQPLWDMVLILASSPQLMTSCLTPGYIIVLRTLNSTRRQPRPSPDLLISSTGCTCYLHRCISHFDGLAGVSMQQSGCTS